MFTVRTGMGNVRAARYLSPNGERRIIGSFSHGSQAGALPQAVGAQFTDRNRQVVSMSGDGGSSLLRGDFLTLVQYGPPVEVGLFDKSPPGKPEGGDTGFRPALLRDDGQEPRRLRLARTGGAYGVRAAKPAQLTGALEDAVRQRGPAPVGVPADLADLSDPPKTGAGPVAGFARSAHTAVRVAGDARVIPMARSDLRDDPRP
ncbi:hypothetical protein Snoj_09450 [Streptomyces nojiriensis]|uniref:Thiamine pyrophosphate enzyme TPP-binding domain-containing protein n=1 Tax=Streptomyces nojiriensis TaxID=66374 RepID=A0ABQ3SG39_9ACTN|nr:thiamine pyrophosphate-dependent enzyme [Streptomyces nojiriensis]QTI48667.1 Pyruvate dehydrogenase [ubiquinone] [Streptomyces nojiriensis]GGS27159.1 hypothetical protein GCM10010205_66300 [Streptomyces nojiriensis]GHI67027.1 hypothetical protein Snoj_09450 [Streptomyces nojiriensis]